MIRRDVDGVRGDGDRRREGSLLPARRALVREGDRREQRARCVPQIADVRPAVCRALVETQTRDEPVHVGAELHADFDRVHIARIGERWQRVVRPERARTTRRDGHAYRRRRRLEVAAVVDGARHHGDGARDAGRPAVGPAVAAGRRMPGQPAVDRDLDAGDAAAGVSGCSGDDDRLILGQHRRRSRKRHRGRRRGRVGRCCGGCEARSESERLYGHIGEQVDGRLLHPSVRDRAAAVVDAVKAPRPLHRAGAKHERATGRAIHRQAVGRRSRSVVAAHVEQELRQRHGGRRRTEETRGTGAVVEIGVPFVAERSTGQRGRRARRERRDRRIPPEPQAAVGVGDVNGPGGRFVGDEDGAGEGVLRTAAVGRRAEPRIAPGAGPRRVGIDLRVVVRFFVPHERAIGRRGAVDARFPPRLPEQFVPAEERQVNACVACGFNLLPLRRRPGTRRGRPRERLCACGWTHHGARRQHRSCNSRCIRWLPATGPSGIRR